MVRAVVVRLEIDADDPLDQRIRRLPHLVKDESQKVSGIRVVFIKLQGAL